VLDVGGSTGVVSAAVRDAFGALATVLDPSPDELSVAAAAGLENFERVEGLVKLAVEVALISHDLLDVARRWKLAPVREADDLVHLLGFAPLDTDGFTITENLPEILADLIERVGHHRGLVADDALDTPDEPGDALGVRHLESALRSEGRDNAGAMPLPVVEVLEQGNDRRVRAQAVP
jgi:hypothetical protein